MRILITTMVLLLGGCVALPGGQVTDATRVYESFARVIEGRPDIEVVNRKDNAILPHQLLRLSARNSA